MVVALAYYEKRSPVTDKENRYIRTVEKDGLMVLQQRITDF